MKQVPEKLVLSYNNREEVLELPVPLQEWSRESPHNTYNFTTIASGDVKAIGKKKLAHMEVNSEFPSTYRPYMVVKDFPSPGECVATIERWKMSNKPIRVIIIGTDINLAMAIENFSYGKDPGDGSGDIRFSLDLEEYPFLNTERSQRPGGPGDEGGLRERPTELKEASGRVTRVMAGDNVFDLADKFLGSPSRFKEITSLNKMKDAFDIFANKLIRIPDRRSKK